MSYTINSAKDSLGNEDQFVVDFAKNQQAILAYQAQYGGDLESAYQGVTGRPWPAGRSVKLNNGQPMMTKDRTTKSVLGKYVLPIAAAVAAPWLIPLLVGGGGSAAGGIAAANALEGMAVPGLAGSGFGMGAGAAGVGMGGLGVGIGEAGATIGSSLGAGVGIGETAATAGLAGSGFAGSAGGIGATQVGGAGSTMGSMLGKVGGMGKSLAGASSMFGASANSQAGNRETTGQFTQAHDRLRLQGQQDRRAEESDALKKLAITSYLKGGGNPYTPPTNLAGGGTLPDFGFGAKAPSAAQIEGAGTLQAQMLDRLKPGGSFTPSPRLTYTTPSRGERIANAGSLIAGGLSAADTFLGDQPQVDPKTGQQVGGGGGLMKAGKFIAGLYS